MKEKIKKILFEVSINSRISTKELGKRAGASQQSASYLLNILKKRKLIENLVTVVDAVKLGYINVLVGFNFIKSDNQVKKDIINELKKMPEIILIEGGKEGVDLLVEYSAPNLSAFNKINSEVIYNHFKDLRVIFVFPIIVNHEYSRKYLSKKIESKDLILSGDRPMKELSEKEQKVLEELIRHPDKRIIDISTMLSLSVKSVLNIKKNLEKSNS